MKKSLNNSIAEVLDRHKAGLGDRWLESSPINSFGGSLTPAQELTVINHFLNIQLGLAKEDNIQLREYLDNNSDITTWLKYFSQHIAPVIVNFGLPLWNND